MPPYKYLCERARLIFVTALGGLKRFCASLLLTDGVEAEGADFSESVIILFPCITCCLAQDWDILVTVFAGRN